MRIIGKPLQVQDTSVLLEANGQILVKKSGVCSRVKSCGWQRLMGQDMQVHPTNAVEVVGKVNPDLSIQMFTFFDFGNNIGLLQPNK